VPTRARTRITKQLRVIRASLKRVDRDLRRLSEQQRKPPAAPERRAWGMRLLSGWFAMPVKNHDCPKGVDPAEAIPQRGCVCGNMPRERLVR